MMLRETLTQQLTASPDVVFQTLIDPHRLPDWNEAITKVVDCPAVLEPGTEWTVEMSALGRRWPSRSQVRVLDHAARHFEYTSQSDDGNPSYAVWSWSVSESAGGCQVSVSWQLNPKSFWRRALLVKVRQYQLMKSEVPASLAALDTVSLQEPVHGE